jgi:hypothetical protein
MILVISQAAFDEIARAVREQVPPDDHDAYFVNGTIDMDRVTVCGPAGIVGTVDGSGYAEGEPK